MGPRSFYEGQHFTFANGDQVEAIGSKAQFLQGSDALLARQIKKGNLVLPLRDEHRRSAVDARRSPLALLVES